jgi:hypothetical protein
MVVKTVSQHSLAADQHFILFLDGAVNAVRADAACETGGIPVESWQYTSPAWAYHACSRPPVILGAGLGATRKGKMAPNFL